MGSSGGTSHAGPPNNNTTQPGGHGGGAVVLEAATVVVNGTIVADGDSANALFNSGPGGGAGGSIVIKSNIFTFDPATASMSARGGDGASGASLGGSGGGGLILFISDDNSSTVPTDVTGGAAVLDNGGTPCAGTAGTAGIVQLLPENATCIDADGDGAPNEDCDHAGGNDCEDGNPNVSPDLPELCNNIDDNCDGQVDEGDDDASGAPPQLNCSVTEICVNGACVQPEVDAGIDAPAPEAPETRLRGGIGGTECAASSIGADGSHWGMHAAWITALLAALGLRRRR
jgi:hypothetical protein